MAGPVATLFIALLFLGSAVAVKRALGYTPSQIHLMWTPNPTEMAVTFVSWWEGSQTTCTYGPYGSKPTTKVAGNATEFVDGGLLGLTRYVHRAVMTGLVPGKRYQYFLTDESYFGVSDTFDFYARSELKPGVPFPAMKFAVYGDFGLVNEESLPLLKSMAQQRAFDAVLHNGDFGYNLDDDQGLRGDEWFQSVQPIAARMAYMASPGNHEAAYNFSHYHHRFTMPQRMVNERDNLYWSLDVGYVHFVAFDSEVFFGRDRYPQVMVDWLERDLAAANRNRANVPWIVVFGHRPFYCSAADDSECKPHNHNPMRDALERLFCQAGVDFIVQSHIHNYERILPVYQHQVYPGSPQDPYDDPPAPCYVVAGSAGCQEDLDPFPHSRPNPWSAKRISRYGVGRMTIMNQTHLLFEQFDANETWPTSPADSFMLKRWAHGAPHPMCP